MVFQCTKTANSKFVSLNFQQCFAFLRSFCYLPYDASNHICCEFSLSALKFVNGFVQDKEYIDWWPGTNIDGSYEFFTFARNIKTVRWMRVFFSVLYFRSRDQYDVHCVLEIVL